MGRGPILFLCWYVRSKEKNSSLDLHHRRGNREDKVQVVIRSMEKSHHFSDDLHFGALNQCLQIADM